MVNYLKYLILIIFLSILSFTNYDNLRDILIRFVSNVISYEANHHKRNSSLIHKFGVEVGHLKSAEYLFIGDSHFVKMFSQSSFPINYLDLSISGETTKGLLNRFDQNIRNLKYKKVIILLGYNDLKYRSVSEIISNYKELIGKLVCNDVYFISLFPVHPKRSIINRKIKEINFFLQSYNTPNKRLHYLNIYALLLNDKQDGINLHLSVDGTHLNAKGNSILSNSITETIIK